MRFLFFGEFRFELGKIKYRLKNVPLQKRINYLIVKLNKTFNKTVIPSYPIYLRVNPFFGCNLHCPKCPAHQGENRINRGALPFKTYKKFIDETGDYSLLLSLWSWGEPFLNENLPEMIEYAKTKKMIVKTSTNGNVLNDEAFNKKIILSGLDELIIALDGPSSETYNIYRKGGEFNKIIKVIETFVELKKKLKVEKPLINLRMVVTGYNETEIPEMKKLAKKVGVDVLTFKTVNPNTDGGVPNESLIPKDERYRRYSYDPVTQEKIEPEKYSCYSPFVRATLYNDGTVVSCEHDYKADFPFGNIKNQSFKEIWSSEAATQFRKHHRENNDVFYFCKNCPFKGRVTEGCVAERMDIKKSVNPSDKQDSWAQ